MMSSEIPDSTHQNFTFSNDASSSTFKSFKTSVPIYSFDWSPKSPHFSSLAIGTFITGNSHGSRRQLQPLKNQVQFVNLTDPQATAFNQSSPNIEVDFPPTKIQYSPHRYGNDELLGVAGDGLKIYRVNESNAVPELIVKLLPAQISTSPTASNSASRRASDANIIVSGANSNSSNKNNFNGQGGNSLHQKNSPAPITSFDWNQVDPNLLVTSSYDTTCAVWNLNTSTVKTQLIAHDKEVFDVAFNPKSCDIFASVGAEGSIRLFDTRSLEHSTILYETVDAQPLLRMAWNGLDNNYVACFGVDATQIVIVDVRSAAIPVAVLGGHENISVMKWAPHNSGWLAVSDAAGVKLWDVSQSVMNPISHLPSASPHCPIQNLVWPSSAPDWMAISTASEVNLFKL